jgi:hypothetical protein
MEVSVLLGILRPTRRSDTQRADVGDPDEVARPRRSTLSYVIGLD